MKLETFLRQNIDHLRNTYRGIFIDLYARKAFMTLLAPIAIPYFYLAQKKNGKVSEFLGLFLIASIIWLVCAYGVFAVSMTIYPLLKGLYHADWSNLSAEEKLILYISATSIPLWLYIAYMLFGISEERKFSAKLKQEYVSSSFEFTVKEYAQAAKALEGFKAASYSAAQAKYGKRVVDLLVLANAVWMHNEKLKRLVSVKSIKEDRAANAEDDKE